MSNVKNGKAIVKITHKKSGATVEFEDGSKLLLSPDSFTESPLYEGKILSEKEIKKLEVLSSADEYYEYALKLCFRDQKTKKEVVDRLTAKGASKETIRSILARLKAAGLIDDRLYVTVYAKDIASLRCYGRKKVLYELKKKGVSEAILNSIAFTDEEELDKATRYAEILNRRSDKVPNAKKKMKMLIGLMERGFDEDIAREAVSRVATVNDPDEERNALAKDYLTYKVRYERKFEGYELKQRVLAALLKKGYRYDDIKEIEGVTEYDD
ncbi:MAG: hypothetical protein ACI32C_06055 [Candidatus Enteromonas sp.]